MGTRADFYESENGETATATWLGSRGWDGYPAGIEGLKENMAEEEWRAMLEGQSKRKDWTPTDRGWPWPWEDSNTTDFAYVRNKQTGAVVPYCFGRLTKFEHRDEEEEGPKPPKVKFPDMTSLRNVTFGERSGLMILGS